MILIKPLKNLITKTSASHHTPDFFLDESGFILGVNAMVNLVADYMELGK
jgi:amidohydrolase